VEGRCVYPGLLQHQVPICSDKDCLVLVGEGTPSPGTFCDSLEEKEDQKVLPKTTDSPVLSACTNQGTNSAYLGCHMSSTPSFV
jgi:hypothetical protein